MKIVTNKRFVVAVLLFVIGDTVTTMYAIYKFGIGIEKNPYVRYLIANFSVYSLMIIKLFVFSWIVMTISVIPDKFKNIGYNLVIGLGFVLTANNVVVLLLK